MGGLTAGNDGAPTGYTMDFYTISPENFEEVELRGVGGPAVRGSNGFTRSGTITRLAPNSSTEVTLPSAAMTVEAIFAEIAVERQEVTYYEMLGSPWTHIGAPAPESTGFYQPGLDLQTNYWTGGSGTRALNTGSSLVRMQKVELTAEEAAGNLTELLLWDGPPTWWGLDPRYESLRAALAHVAYDITGVYLVERPASGDTNYFGSFERYDPNVPDDEYWLRFAGDGIPAGVREIYVQYIPYVRVQWIPFTMPRLAMPFEALSSEPAAVETAFNQPRHGATRSRFILHAYPPGHTSWDPLVPEITTTGAGNPLVGATHPHRNVLRPDAPLLHVTDPTNPDDGTSSTPFVFRVVYAHEDNRAPIGWMVDGPDYAKGRPGGVVLYLDAKGIGDYRPYFMIKQNANDNDYRITDAGGIDQAGVIYYYRIEPYDLSRTFYSGNAEDIVWGSVRANLYTSLVAGRFRYFFGASDDYLRDEEGNLYRHYEVPLVNIWSDIWTEQRYPAYNRAEGYLSNPYSQVNRVGLSPAPATTGYPYDSKSHPNVHPVLMPPEMRSDGYLSSDALLRGGSYFAGTISPYRRGINPLYDYPYHGQTAGVRCFGHFGHEGGTNPEFGIFNYGMETSYVASGTEHTFRIKYQSKDPATGVGIPPAGGVWVYINNAPSAGYAGSTRHSGTGVDPTSPYYYRGYRMQPAPGDPLDYAKGVIYELSQVTLPSGSHTYYFMANDGHRWVHWPVRPDGRWASAGDTTWFIEDAWVPGDEDWADNNDYCPGPYINHKPVLSNASVSPATGPQGANFVFRVTYRDADGQRPWRTDLIIELDRNAGITRRVTMSRVDPTIPVDYFDRIAQFQNGVEYFFNTASAADLVLKPGEHRYYFEFIDDWGRQTDANDRVRGEMVRLPEGEGNWITGPVVMENVRPTLSNGSVTSGDGTATGATLWTFAVTYADANNNPPSFVNLYVGEKLDADFVVAEKRTPVESVPGSGSYRVIQLLGTSIKDVVGVWSSYDDARNMVAATNLYTGGSSFDTRTGNITLAANLPVYQAGEAPAESVGLPKDVYVTYYRREIVWDQGTPMVKSDPTDNRYSDGCRYEVKQRLGGPSQEILAVSPDRIQYNDSTSPPTTTIMVNAEAVYQVLGVFDNANFEGYDYFNGFVQGEEVLALIPGSYNAVTKTGRIVVRHGPVDPQRISGVWKNKQGAGTNYLDSLDTTDATGRTIRLKNLTDATGPFYVTYHTLFKGSYVKVDAAWGHIRIRDYGVSSTEPLPQVVYVTYISGARKYYYAFQASDGKLSAVYSTRIDNTTHQDSRSAGAISGGARGAAGREYLLPVGDNRYEPRFRGPENIDPANRNSQGALVETVLVGPMGSGNQGAQGDILSDPVIYKTDGMNENPIKTDIRLRREYTDVLTRNSDAAGRTIQLARVPVEEEAWILDRRRVQLRRGPWGDIQPKRVYDASDAIFVWNYNDRNLEYSIRETFVPATGATFNRHTGIVDLGADVLPADASVVWVRYHVWGGTRLGTTLPEAGGVSEVIGIWDSPNFRDSGYVGFNYWTCHAPSEYVPVNRLPGGIIRVVVAHSPIQRVVGVWDNPNKTGTNYFDSTRTDGFAQGIVYLKSTLPTAVSNVHVEYYAYGDSEFGGQRSVYDPSIGKITLGRKLPDGIRTAWIEFRQKGDYRLNYIGRLNADGTVASVPSVVFQYDMPAGDPSANPASDPNSHKGYIQADYWFARPLHTKVGYNNPPQLSRGRVSPLEGRTTTDFEFTVDYRDIDGPSGQAPEWVRVVIGGQPYNMQPVVSGTPNYRDGARFRHIGKLPSGSHSYHFEASDGSGFAFFGATGSTVSNIIPLPGPWVNDPPVLSEPLASPNPEDRRISSQDTVDYTVTYTDIDNDPPDTDILVAERAPDLGFPKLWVDNRDRIAYFGRIDKIILEDGIESGSDDDEGLMRARKVKFTPMLGPNQSVLPTFGVDTFAGRYLQITEGSLKGRIYKILNNTRNVKSTAGGVTTFNDYLTLIAEDVVEEGLTVGTHFVIGPITMTKEAGESDFTRGVEYKATVPRMAAGDHNFHFTAQSTSYIPLSIGQLLTPPQTTVEQRKRTQSATPTQITSGPSVEVVGPIGNVAPELSGASWTQDSVSKDIFTFNVNYKDQDGHAPTFNEAERVLGYVRMVLTSTDGTKLLAADMYPESWNADFRSPVKFTVEDMRILTGRRLFYFEASDGWQVVTLRSPDFYTEINSPPALREASVSPPTGNEWTSFFEYRVNYYDPDGKQAPSVRLYIDGSPTAIMMDVERDLGGNLPPDAAYGDPARGVNYVKRVTKAVVPSLFTPGVHTYRMVGHDGIDASEPLDGTGPEIIENKKAPQLIPFQILGVETPCEPREGNLTRNYTYKVFYRDDDGDAPIIIDSSGNVVSGIILFIDREPTGHNPGADPTGHIMTVDPNWRGDAGNTVPTAADFKSDEGVLYSKVINGRVIGAGTDHYAVFVAWDGKMSAGKREHEARLKLEGPSISAASITNLAATPSPAPIGGNVTISGRLNPIMTDPGDRYVYFRVTRPDGTRFDLGDNAKVECNASTGAFQLSLVSDLNRRWQVEISWPGNSQFERVVETFSFDVRMEPYVIKESADDIPVIDMIACPLIPTTGIPDTLFGVEEASLLRIQRWDPSENMYFRFGETFFPLLTGGDGMWIFPTEAYPKTGTGDMGQRIRVIAPFGRLHPQEEAFRLPIRRGWNQVGSVFVSDLHIDQVRVRYQGTDVSLSQAAAAGIVRDYFWGWDALRDPVGLDNYFLVHATRQGAQRHLKPWQGYWIRAFMDTELILYPPVPGALSSASYEEVGPASMRGWDDLDQPPPSPRR